MDTTTATTATLYMTVDDGQVSQMVLFFAIAAGITLVAKLTAYLCGRHIQKKEEERDKEIKDGINNDAFVEEDTGTGDDKSLIGNGSIHGMFSLSSIATIKETKSESKILTKVENDSNSTQEEVEVTQVISLKRKKENSVTNGINYQKTSVVRFNLENDD